MSDTLQMRLSDPQRLTALRDAVRTRPYPHPSFDAITRVVARVLDVPVSLVSLVDDEQQVFVGATGLSGDLLSCRATALSRSFCKHVVDTAAVLRIDDARTHPLVQTNPATTEDGVVGYLGVPLTTSLGLTLGSLCAITPSPRAWSDDDEQTLRDLAVAVSNELELRAELSQAEDAVRRGDRSLDAEGLPTHGAEILESVHEGVAAVDRDWRISFLNQQAARVLGVDAEAAHGRSLWEQFPFLQEPSIAASLKTAAQTRYPASLETYIPTLHRWFELRTFPVRHGLSIYFHDITERREAQSVLATREAQLQHAQKMEAIGALAGGVAHDFNNLLTIIRANGELLLVNPITRHAVRTELTEIVAAAVRATALTTQLLAFSRKQVVQPKVMDVANALDLLLPVLHRLMTPGISLETQVDPFTPPVLADPGHIEQLLMNLVVNARESMTKGGVVQVRLSSITRRSPLQTMTGVVEPGRYLQIVVSDTGAGIAPDILPRIFEPFFSTKPEGSGIGLGLATVFGIVQDLRGGITVDTTTGAGSMFRVLVPVVDGPGAVPLTASALPATDRPRGTECILIVDDESGIRSVVGRVLGACGYQLLMAEDGADALRQLVQSDVTVDLVLTDVMMPGMTGLQLAEAVRVMRPTTPVLLMSGFGDADSIERQLTDPRVRFLAKPFHTGALEAAVRAMLEASHDQVGA